MFEQTQILSFSLYIYCKLFLKLYILVKIYDTSVLDNLNYLETLLLTIV